MAPLPERHDPSARQPERRLTPEQLELVIRRAVELQASDQAAPADEGISEAELVRIAREVGIEPQYVRRALAESAGPARPARAGEQGLFGRAQVSAARTVPGAEDAVRSHLDQYLREREWLSPVRRLADHTLYEKARGGELARLVRLATGMLSGEREPEVGAGFQLRQARRVQLAVHPLEEGFSHVSLLVDISNFRTGFAAGGVVGGGGGAVVVGASLALAVAPVASVLALPVLGGAVWGARALHARVVERAQLHLESLLDSLERGEPLIRPRPAARR